MDKVVAIFGYNNTRLYDVIKIKNILEKQRIDVLLCKDAFASFQYCKFMWGLGKEASTNISSHRFFRPSRLPTIAASINHDAQASYGSIEGDTESVSSQASLRSRPHP